MSIPQGLPVTEGIGRQVDYWLTVYRRTWKGTAISSFVAPLFYVLAMGVLLGGFIEGDPAELEGATSYLAFLVPGLVAAHAMQTAVGETTYPVMGMIKWQRIYDSMLATPLVARDLVLAHLAFVTFRVASSCAVFMVVVAPFGVFASWWGALLAFGVQVLVGTAFGSLVYALTARLSTPDGFALLFRLGVFPMFLFSGAFFPIANLGPRGRVGGPAHAPVARRAPVADVLPRPGRLGVGRRERRRPPRAHRPRRALVGHRTDEAAGEVMATTLTPLARRTSCSPLTSGAAMRLILLRNFLVYRKGGSSSSPASSSRSSTCCRSASVSAA